MADNSEVSLEQVKQLKEQVISLEAQKNEAFRKYRDVEIMQNFARQMRTESPGAFPFLRDTVYPADPDINKFFKRVYQMEADEIRQFGQQIFDRVINYLRILAFRHLYPKGDLCRQILVQIDRDGRNLTLKSI